MKDAIVKKEKTWCYLCEQNHHDYNLYCSNYRENRFRDFLLHCALLFGFGVLITWLVVIANVLYSNFEFRSSFLGVAVLPVLYLVGQRSKAKESLNFLYGWRDKDTSILPILFRYLIIVSILVLPFTNGLYKEYFQNFISKEHYWPIEVVVVFLISIFFAATLNPLKEDYKYSIESIAMTLRELKEFYVGCKYYPLMQKIIIENLNDSRYISRLKWVRPNERWKLFVLREIDRILGNNFSISEFGGDFYAVKADPKDIELLRIRTKEGLEKFLNAELVVSS